jgi:hypothetical protein
MGRAYFAQYAAGSPIGPEAPSSSISLVSVTSGFETALLAPEDADPPLVNAGAVAHVGRSRDLRLLRGRCRRRLLAHLPGAALCRQCRRGRGDQADNRPRSHDAAPCGRLGLTPAGCRSSAGRVDRADPTDHVGRVGRVDRRRHAGPRCRAGRQHPAGLRCHAGRRCHADRRRHADPQCRAGRRCRLDQDARGLLAANPAGWGATAES